MALVNLVNDEDDADEEEDEDEDEEEDGCGSRPAARGHWTTNVSTTGRRSFAERDSESTRANDST
jgi:hypothetical protein